MRLATCSSADQGQDRYVVMVRDGANCTRFLLFGDVVVLLVVVLLVVALEDAVVEAVESARIEVSFMSLL